MPRTFAQIIASIPDNVLRCHHGRSPAEGFDCVGIPFYVYREAGWPLDAADMPYSEYDAERINREGFMERQLSGRLADVTHQVRMANDVDGDIWIFGVQDGLRHAGIYAAGQIVHMTDRLNHRDAIRIRPYLKNAFRIPKQVSLF